MACQQSRFAKVSFGKAASRVICAVNFCLISSIGMFPAFAANSQLTFAANSQLIDRDVDLSTAVDSEMHLAQATNTLLFFRTSSYAVRVFQNGNSTRMNVFDVDNNILRLDEGAASFTISGGFPTYISTGSFSANTATYRVRVEDEDRIRFTIENGAGQVFADQVSQSIEALNVDLTPTQVQGDTILRFETDAYAVRVFSRNEQSFMNVHNTFSGLTEVNGAAANLAPNNPPYERAVSYVSSGERSDRPVQYFARILNTGEAILEIYNVNGQRIFQESGVGPITINIPEGDLPMGLDIATEAEGAFVAAVFGDDGTLTELQRIYPDARMEDSRLGAFIHAGGFTNRDSAAARVLELRGLGFNSRVIYRDVEYR